jgi:AcrR family transcriptional regulator
MALKREPRADRAQLTPEDWIRAATELLIHRSIDAVRVDVLAKIMEVTRGSFYWHFTDRDDLLKRVLLAWQEAQTEQIIARYRKQGVGAEALIRELVELPFHGRAAMKGSSVELAIRAWARRDEMARNVVDAVDAKRLAYLEECFAKLGFATVEAKSRAFLLYCYMQSESLFRSQGSAEDKSQRRRFVADVLLAARR